MNYIITRNLLFIILIQALSANAQPFYIKLNAGYGESYASQPQSYFYANSNGPGYSYNYFLKDNITPLGKGLYWGVGAGYLRSKYIALELSVEYMTGYENGEVDLQDDAGDNDNLTFNGEISGIFIIPGITISSNNTKKIFFYGRLSPTGVIYYSNEKGYDKTNQANFQQPYTAVTLGYSIAAGADYLVEKHWHLFLEVTNKGTTAPNFWNAYYNSYIDLIGVNIGVKYYLGKQG